MQLTDEDLARTAGEREVLEAFLDSHRQVAADKLRGLSESEHARHADILREQLDGATGA